MLARTINKKQNCEATEADLLSTLKHMWSKTTMVNLKLKI